MWTRYRWVKHILGFPLVLAALFLMIISAESSPPWYAGMVIALLLGIAYVAEEIVWISRRAGRPCARCGEKVPMKSFRVQMTCPQCAQPLE